VTAAIRTTDLTKYYGRVVGVEGLSLEIGQGEIFGFLGANGAGKTTTIRLLLDLLRPTSGTASVLGLDCHRQGLEARRRIGYLPSEMPMYPELTGARYLAFLSAIGPPPSPTRLDALLRRFNVSDVDLHRRMREYSHGMKRKLGLIQALMTDAEVLILDEPTSGLDPLGRLLVRDIIMELRTRGTTVFLNSHLLGEVEATCDRVAFVKQGRTVRELALTGTASGVDVEIRADPVDASVTDGLAQFGTEIVRLDGQRLRMHAAGDHVMPDIARWLVEQRVNVYALHSRRKSLEEWFVEVMGADQRPG
jgi:ABC-2 type transport system ATP-binding protein